MMLRLKRLLLPVDYSPRSLAAADCVRTIASRSAVEVTVMHVTDARKQRRADEEVVRAFAGRLSGLHVEYREAAGDAAYHIVEYERSRPTDLIVMPTRAGGVFERLLRGSVTERVLRGVECPVWTGSVRDRQPAQSRIASIACGIDLGARSADVLRWAAGFAERFGAPLTIIHANERWDSANGVAGDPEYQVKRELRSRLNRLLAKSGVEAEVQLVDGAPAAAVPLAAERLGADMLVIGRSPKGPAGTRADGLDIIRRSPCWVVSVDPTAYPYEEYETTREAVADKSQPDHSLAALCASGENGGSDSGAPAR